MIKKGKKCLYCLCYIFAACLLCLHTSQAVNAVGVNINVTPIGSWSVTSAFQTYNACAYNNSVQPAYATNNGSTPCTTSMQLRGIGGLGFNRNYVFGITQYFYELRDREPINDYINQSASATVYNASGALWVADFLGYEVNNFSESANAVTFYFKFGQAQSGTFTNDSWMEIETYPGVQPNEFIRAPSEIKLYSIPDGYDSQGIINAINDLEVTVEGSSGVSSEQMSEIIDSQTESINNPEWHEEEREEMQTAQDDADDAANNSSDEAESQTQSLRQGITNIITLVRDTPASDCNIRINFRIDTGVMNMCQMPEQFRTTIQTVTTIVGVIAVLNISYELLLMYIDYIRSFQDGGKEDR